MSDRTFRNILNRKEFDKLSTPEKLKLALKKNIFELPSNYPEGRDFSESDFSKYSDEEFDFFKLYDVDDDFSIILNNSISDEIYEMLCLKVQHTFKTHQFPKEILFKLQPYNSIEEMLDFLNQEINKVNPFQLEGLIVDFDKENDEIRLHFMQGHYLVFRNQNLVYDWLTDGIKYDSNFKAYETVNIFCESYEKFIYAQYCYDEMKSIKKQRNNTEPLPVATVLEIEGKQQSSEIKPNEDSVLLANPYPHVFSNGFSFQLFNRLYENYKDTNTRLADFSFIYRKMYGKNGKYLLKHQKPEVFREWLSGEPYNMIIENKFKTLDNCKTVDKENNFKNIIDLVKIEYKSKP